MVLLQRWHPGSDSLSNLIRSIFLKVVKSSHGYLGLRCPGTAELPRRAGKGRSRVRIHEQLGNLAVGEPFRIGIDDVGHLGREAINGKLAWPTECRAASLAWHRKSAAIVPHFFVGQLAEQPPRQHGFNEEIALPNPRIPTRRPPVSDNLLNTPTTPPPPSPPNQAP